MKQLLLVFAGVLVINMALSAVLWARQRTPLYRALFGLWAFGILSVIVQALVQSDRWMAFAFGFGSFPVHLMLADLISRTLELRASWRVYGWAFAAGVAASAIATWADAPFWARALPLTLGSSLPLFDLTLRAIRLPRRTLSTIGWSAIFAMALIALHELDYPFLRDDPRFATFGFVFGILAVFAMSITCPAIIVERIAEENRRTKKEVQRLNVQLEERIDQALAAVRARDEFLSIASHELRTPLTALRLQTQLAERQKPGDIVFPQRLQVINRHIERLEGLVNRLLDLSRITSHRFDLDCSDVDLSAIAKDVAARMQPAIAQAQSTLNLTLGMEGPIAGRWDALRLEQVVVNLVSNAVKFGGDKPIEMRLEDKGDTVQLTVADRGIGISPEHQQRIFLPFERACSSRHYGGLGLGLWISAEIVKAHQGTITVSSEEGQGALFTVLLPKWPKTVSSSASLPVSVSS